MKANLVKAHKKLTKELILTTFKQTYLAVAGTKKYGFENIVGVGISEKMIGSQYIGEPCLTVFVVKKADKRQIVREALVPNKIMDVSTDVVETGEIRSLANVGRYRPAPAGVSVGHYQITAGTLGCLVKKNNQIFVLSNNHVLANSNSASVNDPILQPGPYDGGQVSTDRIARLSEFIPIKFDGTPNTVDAAIARATTSAVTAQNKCFGTITSNPSDALLFMIVKKCGRTTELTRGLVISVAATVRVGYGNQGTAIFQNQFLVTGVPFIAPFSGAGDSGSLVLTQFGNNPVGLLFAGSILYTVVNPIKQVLSAFNITVMS